MGFAGTIVTSPDGIVWASTNSTVGKSLSWLVYGNNTWVAVGAAGTILSSTDGAQWFPRNSQTQDDLYGVAYGNGLFVVVGNYGRVVTSADGNNWVRNALNQLPTDLEVAGIAVTYGNGLWVTAGSYFGYSVPNLFIATYATNGWTESATVENSLISIACGNGTFVVVGDSGTIVTSVDGTNWVRRNSGTANWFGSIAYGNGSFVAVGQAGTILQSGIVWPTATATSPIITNARLAGHTFSLSVSTTIGRTYFLEYKNALADATWTVAQTLPGTGSPMSFTDDTTAIPARFYRVRVQ